MSHRLHPMKPLSEYRENPMRHTRADSFRYPPTQGRNASESARSRPSDRGVTTLGFAKQRDSGACESGSQQGTKRRLGRITDRIFPLTLAITCVVALLLGGTAQAGVPQKNRAEFHDLFPHVDGRAWDCVKSLYQRESGWHHRAMNGPLGGNNTDYGIPQLLLPKMSLAEIRAWRNNPTRQLKAGSRYVKARYGSYCAAWNHSQGTGWY